MESRYLVTGATGFVGSNIVRRLVNENKKVAILTRNKQLNWRLADIGKKITFYQADLLHSSLADIILEINPTYIFHLAAYGSLPSESDFSKMVDINIKGTRNLLDALTNTSYKIFINTGSSSEYGIKQKEMSEADVLQPVNDYGVTKATSTLYCQKLAQRENLPIVTLRLFSPYGYFEDKTRLVPHVILNCLQGKQVSLSSPRFVRDFLFIEDVVQAYVNACNLEKIQGEVINIGSGRSTSIQEVVEEITHELPQSSRAQWGEVKQQTRQIEPLEWKANISKAEKLLDWRPKTSLRDGIKKTIKWFKENQSLYEK